MADDASQIPGQYPTLVDVLNEPDYSKLSDADLKLLHAAGGDYSKLDDDAFHRIGRIMAPAAFKPSGEDTSSMAGRFATGFGDQIHGGAQLLSRAASDLTSSDLGSKKVDTDVRARELAYNKSRGEEADNFDIWRLAGNVANPLNYVTPGASLSVAARPLVTRMFGSGVSGGTSAAFQPVTDVNPADYWGEKGKQAGIGFGAGAVMAPITGALARWISPNASRDPTKQLLRQEGVPMTVGQTLGGTANALEQAGMSVPWAGPAIGDARRNAVDAWRRAFINRSQRPLEGGTTPLVPGAGARTRAQETTYDALNEAQGNVSAGYTSARNQLNNFRVDNQFQTDLAQLQAMTANEPWANDFNRIIRQNVTNRLSPAGGMTAQTYHDAVKELGELASRNTGSKLASQQQYGRAIQQLNALMEQQARRVNPQAQSAFRRSDAGFANLAGAQRAANLASGAEGDFTPSQLATALKGGDRTARKNATARGRAEGQDLSIAGVRNLRQTVPDSGTAGRVLVGSLMTGAGHLFDSIPELALLTAGARAAYSAPAQRLGVASIMNRPAGAQAIANRVRETAPLLAPLSSLTGLEYSADD